MMGVRVNFVEFNARVNTLALRSVFPKYGTPLLAAVLRGFGHDVKICLEGVSDMSFERLADADFVCLPLFCANFNKVREFCLRMRAERPSTPLIVGGPQAILHPETALPFSDYVVCCEGDEALPELIGALSSGVDVSSVRGLLFKRGGEAVRTPDREPPAIPETAADLTLIDGFERASKGLGRYLNVTNAIQTSRGCKFHCKFCPTGKLFAGSYRNREPESVIREIRERRRHNSVFFVVDNSFFGDREKAKHLLRRIAEEDLGVSLALFERHEIARDAEAVELMRRANVACLIVGVESLVDRNLAAFDKRQGIEEVEGNIRRLKGSGIHVAATFAIGHDWDTVESIDGIPEFVMRNDLTMNAFILHDVSEGEEEGLMVPHGRRFLTYYRRHSPDDTTHYDYHTGSFATYFPLRMKPSVLQLKLIEIYKRALTHRSIIGKAVRRNNYESLFGVVQGYGVKRMNESIERVVSEGYLEHLERLEYGLYDSKGVLDAAKLRTLGGLPPPPPLEERVDLKSYQALTLLALVPSISRLSISNLMSRLRAPEEAVLW